MENSQIEKTVTVQQTGKQIKVAILIGALVFWSGLAFTIWGSEGVKVLGLFSMLGGGCTILAAKIARWWHHS